MLRALRPFKLGMGFINNEMMRETWGRRKG